MMKKIWSDAVWSKIIASAIIGLATYAYVSGWGEILTEFIQSPPSIPNKVVILLCGAILIFLLIIIVFAILLKRQGAILRLKGSDSSQKDIFQLRNDIKKKIQQLATEAEIQILTPQDGANLSPPVNITGYCKSLPEGFKLCVFTMSGEVYWPRDYSHVKADHTWNAQLNPTIWTPNERRVFGVFLVGEEGQALIHHFIRAGKELSPTGNPGWPGLSKLTDDIVQCGQSREVYLKENLKI